MEFAYDGGGLAKGGDVTLYYDGDAGRHRPRRSDPADGLLRRRDDRHRLRVRHHRDARLHRRRRSRFTGKIHWVQIDVGNDDHDHFIDPDGAPPGRDGAAVDEVLTLSTGQVRGGNSSAASW